MKLSARFSSALAALPDAVRARLDGDSDLDWDSLADRTTAFGIDEAARAPARLPAAVETLIEQLVADIGIAPAELLRGVQGSGIAGTWMLAVAVEPDGERYRLRIKRSGELLHSVHPSALAGYVVLGMELATTVQLTCEAWTQAGEQAQGTPGDSRDSLTQCALQMLHRLRAFSETASSPPSTLVLARSMEDEWNTQTLQMREALARWQIACPWDAHAPRAHYYAVETSYRLHAFDIAEARWLRALAGHAASVAQSGADDGQMEAAPDLSPPQRIQASAGIATGPARQSNAGGDAAKVRDDGARSGAADAPVHAGQGAWQALDDPHLDEALKSGLVPDGQATGEAPDERPDLEAHPGPEEQRSASGTVPEPFVPGRISGEMTDDGADLVFGTTEEVRSPQAEIDLLVQASQRVPAAVTHRLGEAYGDSVVKLLGRLQDSSDIQDLRDTLGTKPPGNALPGWMEELAAKLLLDTGAQTRDGQRTGPARLGPERRAEGYEVSEIISSASGILRAIDLIEQVRLSLGFVSDTWSALTLLSDAGKEAEWTLHDAAVKQARLTRAERTRLEATQRIEHELRRIRQAKADGSSFRPSALEEAALVAGVLKSLQPSERADAGRLADIGLPNPCDPGDVAQVMATAETLHRDVRAIANRLITVWVADGHADRGAQGG